MRLWTAAVAAARLGAAGCGTQAGAAPPKTVTVFAAASLTQAFTSMEPSFERANPGYRLQFNFAGTPTLLTQLEQGAHADVFASADQANMARATAAQLVDGASRVFALNRLEIAVAPGNPKHIATLADLARSGVTLVLAAPTVPAGKYAAQALARAGVAVEPKSLELDVESTLAKVELGQADAAIVYTTDVQAAGARVSGVPIPATWNVVATYPVAQVAHAPDARGAKAFIGYLLGPSGRLVLGRFGFELP